MLFPLAMSSFLATPLRHCKAIISPDILICVALQVIALRIWRILTAMGLSSIPVEEAYPAVCRHLEPHLDRQMVPGPTAQEHADLEASIGAEALGLFWTAFQHDA